MAVFTPEKERKNVKADNPSGIFSILIHRGYYTVARRYEFYFRVAKQYFTNNIDKIIEGNDRNYVIDKLTCEIMENNPLGSWK